MAYRYTMELVETPVFTRQVTEQFSPEEYRAFQLHLMLRPDAGDVIPASSGLRKVRWVLPGRGKRGEARIIYYWRVSAGRIYLLFLYPKNVRSDLTQREIRILRSLIRDE
jgi:hypothetical protein